MSYCPSCCYETMFICNCGTRLCEYCGPVYKGPWPSYVNNDNKYLYKCCLDCGQKYENEVKITELEKKLIDCTIYLKNIIFLLTNNNLNIIKESILIERQLNLEKYISNYILCYPLLIYN